MRKNSKDINIPGHLLAKSEKTIGRYAIGMEIGNGNYGKVSIGYHLSTKQVVAIKQIPRHLKDVADDIRKEARLLLQLQHPNIVHLYGYYDDEHYCYLILEYCRHGDLYDFLKNFPNSVVPEYQARILAQQIFSGIKCMYENNIVHRDLKLENILIAEDYTPKIADFGLGRVTDSGEDVLKTFCGTPIGMAPEIKLGATYDAKCDIWSLGVMLYEILFGRLPFGNAKSRGDVIRAIEKPEWPPFPKLANVSDAAKNLLKKMLVGDPKERIGFDELFKHKWITGEAEIPNPIINYNEEQKQNGSRHPEKLFWYDKEKVIDQKQKTACKLFEEFFIVGVDQQDTQGFEKSCPENPKNIIKDYCFPFGVDILKERINSLSDLYERASIQNSQEIPENFFIFRILSDQSAPQNRPDDEIINRLNPDRVLYIICARRPYYVELVLDLTKSVLKNTSVEQIRTDVVRIVQSLENQVSYEETMSDFKREFLLLGIVKPYLAKLHELEFSGFDSQVEITEERFEKVSYHLQPAEETSLIEGEWAGPIVFSYFPLNDLLHLLSLVLLEKRIILFSKNLALLTSTMVSLYAFIKPLSYPFPVIFMQENQFDFLDAPTPMIAGINKGLDFVLEKNFPTIYNGNVLVVLETDRIIMFGDTIDAPEFDFTDFRNSVVSDYKSLNNNTENLDTSIYYLSSTEQATFLQKNWPMVMRSSHETNICYYADSKKLQTTQRILSSLHNCLESYLCELLPEEPKRFDLSNELDNSMIEKYARERSGSQSLFLNEFVLGQQFRNFSIKFYQKMKGVIPKKSVKATEADILKVQLLISRTQMKRAKTALWIDQQLQSQSLQKERAASELRNSSEIRKSSTKKSFLFF